MSLPIVSHIRWKIVAPYLLLTLGMAMTGTFIATRLVTGSLQERFDNQLAEAARVASDSVVRRERAHLSLVRGIAFTMGVPEGIAAGDEARLREIVEPLAANAKAEYVEVLGANGQRLLGLHLADEAKLAYTPMTDAPDRSSFSLVQSVLQREEDDLGDKFAQVVELPEGFALYTAGPVFDGERLVGVVLVGSLLESLLPAIKGEALADVTFYDFDGRVLASTLDHDEEEQLALAPAGLAENEGAGGYREVKELFGRSFDFLYGDLRIRDQSVGRFSIALPSSFISGAGSTARWGMSALFAVATLAVLGAGLIVARDVTAPLLRLVRSARAVTEGDLTARAEIESKDEVGTLARSFDAMTQRLADQHLATIRALTSAIDARDPYTAGHSVRVGQLAQEIGRALDLPSRDLQFLEIGGYLHDIGKIGIRDNVLLKEGNLTPEERALIEEHPRIGLRIVQYVDLAEEVRQFIAGHHEKLDGSGYPYGIEEQRLGIFARIGAVADIYDALTTDRPYRRALTVERAVDYLKSDAKLGHLDATVVQALIMVLPIWGRKLRTEGALQGLLLPELQELERPASQKPDIAKVGV